MNKFDTRQLLGAALIFLLTVLVAPSSAGALSAKDVSLADTTLTVADIQGDCLDTPEGDQPELHRAPDWVRELPQQQCVTNSPDHVAEPVTAFTVSQARAPPQL